MHYFAFVGESWQLTANLCPAMLGAHACYYHRINEQLQLGGELEISPANKEAVVRAAYQMEIPSANVNFKGKTCCLQLCTLNNCSTFFSFSLSEIKKCNGSHVNLVKREAISKINAWPVAFYFPRKSKKVYFYPSIYATNLPLKSQINYFPSCDQWHSLENICHSFLRFIAGEQECKYRNIYNW